MGRKVQRNIYIDKTNDTYLKENPQINASALINRFLTQTRKEEPKK